MSKINGKSSHEWIEKNHPQDGEWIVYYKKADGDNVTLDPNDADGKRWQFTYKNGVKINYSYGWYRDGTLKQVKYWKDGKKHGELIRYYPNGQINDHFFYKNGKRHGTFTSYFVDGECRGQGVWNDGVLEKYIIPQTLTHKVSYILVWSDTNTMNRNDPECYNVEEGVNKELLKHTLYLIDQILELNPFEILIMDNEGNFPKHENDRVKVIPSYQSVGYFDGDRPEWLDKVNISDYREDRNFNAAKSTAMAYNHGIIEASGDYLVLQHNDTLYLFDEYSKFKVIPDAINLLERENYEYMTVDKKPVKHKEYEKYEYFADCYWFLCRSDFYSKHDIWVDWIRGDNNHLATITCHDKGLKYLHLPGFFETYEHKLDFNKKYGYTPSDGNVHIFNDTPFIIHRKGGTGLFRILEEKR